MRLRGIRFERPVGVILLAASQVAGAVFTVADLGAWLLGGSGGGRSLSAMGPAKLIFGLVFGGLSIAVSILIAHALWHGRAWVWYLSLGFLVLGLFGPVALIGTGDPMLLAWTAFSGALIVYFLLPNVRAHFGTASSA